MLVIKSESSIAKVCCSIVWDYSNPTGCMLRLTVFAHSIADVPFPSPCISPWVSKWLVWVQTFLNASDKNPIKVNFTRRGIYWLIELKSPGVKQPSGMAWSKRSYGITGNLSLCCLVLFSSVLASFSGQASPQELMAIHNFKHIFMEFSDSGERREPHSQLSWQKSWGRVSLACL